MNLLTDYYNSESGLVSVLFAFLILSAAYITGSIFIQKNRSASGVVLTLATGLFVLTLSYAFLISAGKTIFLGTLPVIVFLIHTYRKEFALRLSLPDRKIVLVILASLVLLSIKNFFVFEWQTGIPDNAFYARISYALRNTGIENEYHFLNELNPAYHGLSPYHYFELWFNGIGSAISGFTSLTSYLTITPLVLETVLLFAIIAFASAKENEIKGGMVVISFLILSTSSINIFSIVNQSSLKDFAYLYTSIFCSNEVKFTVPALLFAAVILSSRNENYKNGAVLLSLFPIFSYALLPASVFAFAGYCFIYRKKFSGTQLLQILFVFTSSIAILFYLYHSGLSTGISRDGVKITEILNNGKQGAGYVFTGIKIFIASLLSIPVDLLFFFLPCIFYLKKLKERNTELLEPGGILFVLLLTGGAAAWAMLNTTLNAVQLFYISVHSFMFLIAALYPVYKNHLKSFGFYIIVLGFGVFITVRNIQAMSVPAIKGTPSDQFTRKVVSLTAGSNPGSMRIGFIKNPAAYTNAFHCYPHFSIPLPSMARYTDSIVPISLSEYYCNSCLDSDACEKGLKLGLLYQWQSGFPGRSVCDFIVDYRIGYLLVEKDAPLPECGTSTLTATDIKTGMRFYRIH